MTDLTMVYGKRQETRQVLGLRGGAGRFARPLAILLFGAALACAQSSQDTPQPSTTFASQFFEHDFVNVFAFGNGLWDSAIPKLTATGSSQYGSSLGYDVGGGITAGKQLKNGTFSFSYKGDYRHYSASTYSNGTNQNASILFTKRLNRQWSISMQGSGGIISYGGQIYSESSTPGTNVLTNPLSSQSRFVSGGVTLTYEQTRRLSYSFSGQGFYNSYNYAGAIKSIGGTGTGSVNYRTTARTTIGGSYSHTYFVYAGSSGTTNIDSGFLQLQHTFAGHWTGSVSVGASRTHSQGVILEPVIVLLDQQLVSGYIEGPYNRVSTSPSFQATVTKNIRHSYFSVNGGQGVNAGNGTLLTSKATYGGATYSLTHGLSNFSFGGGYNRLSSLANTVSETYSSATASVSYGFPIFHYVSGNLRYDFIHYDNLYALSGVDENRITFGISFSSKSIPLTLF